MVAWGFKVAWDVKEETDLAGSHRGEPTLFQNATVMPHTSYTDSRIQ